MIPTHQTAVVLVPPRSAWPPIQAIRRLHDRGYRRWMPHVTLIYPFVPRACFERLLPEVSRAARGWGPLFETTLGAFRLFDHGRGRSTLWLAPDPADPIVDLQAALNRIVPECDDVRRFPDGYTPHLSVGQAPRREAGALRSRLQADWGPVKLAFDRISFIHRGSPPDDVFRVACEIEIGTGRVLSSEPGP